MTRSDSAEKGRSPYAMPSTQWTLFDMLREGTTHTRGEVLGVLLSKYRNPVYHYLLFSGYKREEADDVTQDFFLHCLEKNLFAKADRPRGRFRGLLKTSLKNFSLNQRRYENAPIRHPPGGVVSIEVLEDLGLELRGDLTPDQIFEETWLADLLIRVLKMLESECRKKEMNSHYEIFYRYVVEPILEGTEKPEMIQLAEEYGLTQKQGHNRLRTARRNYQRLLREEVRTHAFSKGDVAEEVRDLFQFFER